MMKRFNNIIANQADYEQLKYYLDTNEIPANVASQYKFLKKFDGFEKVDDKIMYVPLDLEVIEPDQKEARLNEILNDDTNSIGKGIYKLYKYIQSKYIGITRNDVQKQLSSQKEYQMTQPLDAHRTNKPVISKFPNQLWGIDLIDLQPYMSSNYQNRYIMNVVDIFSRKIWLAKLKNKNAEETKDRFEDICNRAGVKPTYLLSDNGTEWKGEFAEFCEDNDIVQRFVRSYSPQANGVVERANKEIRKIIRAIMLQTNRFIWRNQLETIENNRNEAYHSSIKGIPNQVWVPEKTRLTLRDLPESIVKENPRLLARVSIVKKALKEIRKFKEQDDFEVGDMVRVKMSSIFANVRSLVKAKKEKNLVVTFSPELFRVSKVIVPKGVLERKRYIVTNRANRPITTKNNNIVQFYGSELLLWDGENAPPTVSMQRALK
jgi:hypothetical protein